MGGRRSRRSNRALPCWRADQADSEGAPSLAAAIQDSAASREQRRGFCRQQPRLARLPPATAPGAPMNPASLPLSSQKQRETRKFRTPQNRAENHKQKSTSHHHPNHIGGDHPTPRNSRAKTRRGAHLGRIWTKSRARGRLPDARAALPPGAAAAEAKPRVHAGRGLGPGGEKVLLGGWFRWRGWIGEDGSGGDGAASAGGVAGLRFCCAAAAAWRAGDTSREKGKRKRGGDGWEQACEGGWGH